MRRAAAILQVLSLARRRVRDIQRDFSLLFPATASWSRHAAADARRCEAYGDRHGARFASVDKAMARLRMPRACKLDAANARFGYRWIQRRGHAAVACCFAFGALRLYFKIRHGLLLMP